MQSNKDAVSVAVVDGVRLTLFLVHKYPLDYFGHFHILLLAIFSADDQLVDSAILFFSACLYIMTSISEATGF